jgi:DNA polymerase
MIVGEAPGREEIENRKPFVGQSGSLLTSMLLEVGINRNDCFITNVCHERPPGNDIDLFFYNKTEARQNNIAPVFGLYPNRAVLAGMDLLNSDIHSIKPRLIIAFGSTALWALTGNQAIMNWRGSALYWKSPDGTIPSIPLLPTIHPANILRDYSSRFLAVRDLRRAQDVLANNDWPKPGWTFIIKPTFDAVIDWINHQLYQVSLAPTHYAVDIETRNGQIACVGIGRNSSAICIPFMQASRSDGNYWTSEEEFHITTKLSSFLRHPNTHCIFHNGAYDLQYFAKQWGYLPNIKDDTMIMQHVAFPGLRKSLALCSSLYCSYHRYWKDDGKEWTKEMNEEQLWSYNCEDCVRTYEIRNILQKTLEKLNLTEQYNFQARQLFPRVLETMLRGVPIDFHRRAEMDFNLQKLLTEHQEWINTALGQPLNPRSPKQMKDLFYVDLGVPVHRNRKTGKPSLDDEAMVKIANSYPLLKPLTQKILDFRSIGVFLSTFVRAEVPPDGNMRCTYNITGAETFRFSSSTDSFDYGTNLQNIPSGDE